MPSFLSLLLLLLFIIDLPPSATPQTMSPSEALDHATSLWNEGKGEESVKLLRRLQEVTPNDPMPSFYLGSIYQFTGRPALSLPEYDLALKADATHTDTLNNLGKAHSDLGDPGKAREYYIRAVGSNSGHVQSRVNLGLTYHDVGDFHAACDVYKSALEGGLRSPSLRYNYAVSLSHLGSVLESVQQYRMAIQESLDGGDDHKEAWLNLAALHHKHGTLEDAIWHYDRTAKAVLGQERYDALPAAMHYSDGDFFAEIAKDSETYELLVMILNNVGQAMSQQGKVAESQVYHGSAVGLLNGRLEVAGGTEEEVEVRDQLIQTRTHMFRSSKVACDWEGWRWFDGLLWDVNVLQLAVGRQSSLLPFDSLGLPVSPRWRREVAVKHAEDLSRMAMASITPNYPVREFNGTEKLKMGYICYDFNNHPTAHLAEGLFLWHNLTGRVVADAYNYGKDDNSTYRKNIVELVGGVEEDGGRFVELSHLGHDDSAIKLRTDWKPNVLIDMQGFTLGGRPEIAARRVAPIQVNYLIFPGTSGASFMDYIVGDRHVTPAEHSFYYTEKLALMPHSYQINYYGRHSPPTSVPLRGSPAWSDLRASYGLPPEAIVFANFNKQDKLEPRSWSAWMNILSRTPRSVLWLLEPSHKLSTSSIPAKLSSEAASRGVNPGRIIFAKRVPKSEHLARAAAADLFLDTFAYGAHSTATDALRGGLPVLSVGGGSFASRVGISLLVTSNVTPKPGLSLCTTVKEFEDVAVLLVSHPSLLDAVTRGVEGSWGGRLFDTEGYTRDFERLGETMWTVWEVTGGHMNVAVAA